MGLFDYFTKPADNEVKQQKQPKVSVAHSKKTEQAISAPTHDDGTGNVAVRVFKPTSYDDVCAIIDFLLLNKPAIVNIEAVKFETAQRVMDILGGAAYALHGSISKIAENIYLISPDGSGM